jgi:hypothetical protein
MAKQTEEDEIQDRPDNLTTFEAKLVNLLALQLVQERNMTEQVSLLNRAGFRPIEIAALLGTTRNMVSVLLYQEKQGKNKPTKRKRR